MTTAHTGNYRPGRSAAIRYLVLHYTAGRNDSAQSNLRYFEQNVVKASAHYFVDDLGWMQSVDDGDTVNIESHMIGFAGDIYGEEVCVRLFQYLRGEVKFQNVEGLRHQLSEDREGALSFFQKGKSMR